MNHAHIFSRSQAAPKSVARSTATVALRLLPVAMLVSACGGGGGDGSISLAPILQVGMQRQYTGTATRAVVYTTPSATTPNNTLTYTFVENQSVLQAPATAPANFDVHIDYTYTVTQDPGIGTVPISESVDNYENLLVSGSTQSTTTLAQNVVQMLNDETSNLLGTGTYTQTDTTASTYPTPRSSFSYPLQTGATMTVPQSSTQTITFTDLNAAGAAPSNGSNIGYTITRNENDDGSYSFQTAYVSGASTAIAENSDGSGTDTYTSATSVTTATTVSVPATASGVTTIPIARTVTSPTHTTNTTYAAADWYPNGGVPNSPLTLQSESVVGPTTTLPPECNGALLRPNIFEIDTTTTTQNTISPSYSVTNTRAFNADGVTICSLSTQTTSSYTLLTGALVSTTTTTTATVLSAINY